MDSIQSLPEHQKAEFMRHVEEKQLQDSLQMYNRVVEACFNDCVSSFRSKKLEDKEKNCVLKCSEKYVKHTQRAGVRFAENQASMVQPQ